MAHAPSWRRRCARNEAGYRLLAVVFDPFRSFFFRRPANLANHDDAMRVGIVVEQFDHVQVRSAVHWIPPDTDATGLADAAAGKLPHGLIRQRPAARDNADVAFLVN